MRAATFLLGAFATLAVLATAPNAANATPAAPRLEAAPSPYLLETGPRCGPRSHYIKGHRNRAGHYVKGHCSHQRH